MGIIEYFSSGSPAFEYLNSKENWLYTVRLHSTFFFHTSLLERDRVVALKVAPMSETKHSATEANPVPFRGAPDDAIDFLNQECNIESSPRRLTEIRHKVDQWILPFIHVLLLLPPVYRQGYVQCKILPSGEESESNLSCCGPHLEVRGSTKSGKNHNLKTLRLLSLALQHQSHHEPS